MCPDCACSSDTWQVSNEFDHFECLSCEFPHLRSCIRLDFGRHQGVCDRCTSWLLTSGSDLEIIRRKLTRCLTILWRLRDPASLRAEEISGSESEDDVNPDE